MPKNTINKAEVRKGKTEAKSPLGIIIKSQLIVLEHIMRNGMFENRTLTKHIENKGDNSKQVIDLV